VGEHGDHRRCRRASQAAAGGPGGRRACDVRDQTPPTRARGHPSSPRASGA